MPKDKKEICRVCRYGTKKRTFGFYMKQRKLHRSASGGCKVCTLILQVIFACLPLSDLNMPYCLVDNRDNRFIWEPRGILIHTRDEAPWQNYELYVLPGKYENFKVCLIQCTYKLVKGVSILFQG